VALQVEICVGSDCGKQGKRTRKLADLFSGVARVKTVKCQDICKGPVVIIHRSHERFWFKKLRNKKSRRALLEFALGEQLSDYLKMRLVKSQPDKTKVRRLS
jgi:hypothetical protein